ncbi:hypothetical protein ACFWY6_07440, partial [Streptomyces sp. NPDC059037]
MSGSAAWARPATDGPQIQYLAPAAHRSNALHPGAWWVWALGLGTAASRTTNPLLLGMLIGVAGYVVAAGGAGAPGGRAGGGGGFVRHRGKTRRRVWWNRNGDPQTPT